MRCGSFYCELWQGFYPFLLPRRLRDQYCAPRLPQFSAMCFKSNWNCAKRAKSIGWGRVKLISQISGYYCLFLGQNSLSSRSLLSLQWWGVRIQRCQCKTLSCTGLSGGTWAQARGRCFFCCLMHYRKVTQCPVIRMGQKLQVSCVGQYRLNLQEWLLSSFFKNNLSILTVVQFQSRNGMEICGWNCPRRR